jgi:hypothetical protein
MSASNFLKRLEALERSISFRRPRCIVVTVPIRNDGTTTAETEAAIADLKREHAVTNADLVVHVARYCTDEPPRLAVTPMA